jgi:hypothetical protein
MDCNSRGTMKTAPKITLVLAALFTLSACGNMKSDRKAVGDAQLQAAKLGVEMQALNAQKFGEFCKERPGVVREGMCIFVSDTKELGSQIADQLKDVAIGPVHKGAAVEALGTVNDGSVVLNLNGEKLTEIPSKAPLVVEGGDLAFQLKPGSYHSVKVRIYTCVDKNLQIQTCPQL